MMWMFWGFIIGVAWGLFKEYRAKKELEKWEEWEKYYERSGE